MSEYVERVTSAISPLQPQYQCLAIDVLSTDVSVTHSFDPRKMLRSLSRLSGMVALLWQPIT